MEALAFGLTYSIAAGLCGVGVGLVGAAALNAVGRNPEKLGEIRTLMILAISFVDALAIIAIIVAIIAKYLK
ncbi:MAG: H(+)-transporting ATPase [Candidatus Chaera renei]|uniref:ATP synthase F(0) sector subunit c n=1 Tax=Candidatus Chaera renei TaxID=2506947 RepID=A0A4Q0AIP9_9BACT|nr:MAG: H(+)-transporting ATPase [Candidatus Chaera renei]